MSKKDPAFLFYPKDWLQGTAKLMPEEKGVYIDLLCHQHQDTDLPNDTQRLARMVGLTEHDFLRIWEVVGKKFKLNSVNRLVNERLTATTTDRLSKGLTNTITGTFASVIRLSDIPFDLKEKIKQDFKKEDFLTVPKEKLTERLTVWLASRLGSRLPNGKESIANANNGINIKKANNGDFNIMPIASDIKEFPNNRISTIIEMMKIMQQTDVNEVQVNKLWDIFKVQKITGKKYYQNVEAIYDHFMNWIKTQKVSPVKVIGNTKGEIFL